MTPIPLIIDAVCESASLDRAQLVTLRGAFEARHALVFLLQHYRKMSESEAAVYTNYSRPGTQRIIAAAKWIVEQRDRPVGDNFRWEWPGSVCHRCRRDMAEVSGTTGNVTHDGKLWCGCPPAQPLPPQTASVALDHAEHVRNAKTQPGAT